MPIAVITTITLIYVGSALMIASATIGRGALAAVGAVRRGPASNAVFYLVLACVIALVGSVSIVAVHGATKLLLILWLALVFGGVAIIPLKRFRYDGNGSLSSGAAQTATVAQLAAVGRVISTSLTIDDVWEELADLIRTLIAYDRISVVTYDPVREAWTFAFIRGVEVSGWGVGDVVPASMSIGSHGPASRNARLIRTDSRGIMSGERLAHEPAINAGLVSGITVPLISNSVVVGGLTLRSGEPGAYTAGDLKLLGHVADQIAGAIQNSELHAALERGAMERKAIAEIGRIIGSSLDTEEVYERFASEVRTIVPSDRIAICLVDAEAQTFSTAYVSDMQPSDQVPEDRTPLEGTIVAEALRQSSGIVVRPDARSTGSQQPGGPGYPPNDGIRSSIAVPLTLGSGTVGVLTVQSRPGEVYTESHLSLAERVGSQIAGAVANSRLYSDLVQA